jgi:uncharacterized protein (TIGR03118 family)
MMKQLSSDTSCHYALASLVSIEPLEPRQLLSGGTSRFVVTNLVSNGAVPAQRGDLNLVNPWGIARADTGAWQVAINGTNSSAAYQSNGKKVPPIVTIPGATGINSRVTGVAYNNTDGFVISRSGVSEPATYVFAGEDGSISAWNQDVRSSQSITVVNRSIQQAQYTGLAIAELDEDDPYVYAANFYSGRIEVFDKEFDRVNLKGSFTDPDMPKGFVPYNVQLIGNRLLVTYAKQASNKYDVVTGRGNGYVNVFRTNGTLVNRLISEGRLDAPWAFAKAPGNFGKFGGDLLVGNFGDGRINAYDSNTGEFQGAFRDAAGDGLEIEGLWGIGFGNGDLAGGKKELYFAAGINGEADGLFGRITPVTSSSSSNSLADRNRYMLTFQTQRPVTSLFGDSADDGGSDEEISLLSSAADG